MDWSKVKAAIGTIAPWLAGTLGSPVAGVAVKALCEVFGLSHELTKPEDLTAAILSAQPAQLQALKNADEAHREFMAKIGYDTLELLNKDRDSARDREQIVKDKTPAVLAGIAVSAFCGMLVFTALGTPPSAGMHDTFMMLIGAAVATFKDVYGYYFGSSSSSRAKDETIKGLTQ